MEKIIIVFDDLLSLRMFIDFDGTNLNAEYFSSDKEKEEDEKNIENINNKIKKDDLYLNGYIPNEEGDSVLYKRKVKPNDLEFLIAIKQNIKNEKRFARVIPSVSKKIFLELDKQKIDQLKKKEVYSKILNSNDDSLVTIAKALEKALQIKDKIKK